MPQVADVLEKVPPHSLDAEMAVLGAMLIEKEAIQKAVDDLALTERHFYRDSHRAIFRVIAELYEKGRAVDTVTVGEELKKHKLLGDVGGNFYLAELVSRQGSAANVEHYARIVKEKGTLRELIRICSEVTFKCFGQEGEAPRLLDEAEKRVLQLSQAGTEHRFLSAKDLAHKALAELERVHKRKNRVTGVPTGFARFDALTAGLQNGDFIVIAARTSQGKTALALNIAAHAALREKLHVALFSLEMNNTQVFNRIFCSEYKVNLQDIRTGFFRREKWMEISNGFAQLSEASIHFDDTPALSVLDLRSRARKIVSDLKGGGSRLSLIVVDYLQLMRGGSNRPESRQMEVTEICRGLKSLARDLDVPVVALSQLSRRVEETGREGRPKLSDLRESGSIEQDADLVAFIYREYAYKRKEEQTEELKRQAEIIIAKQRNGPLGKVPLYFFEETTRFENPASLEDEGG